jgi:hypothetical protein
MFFCDLEIEIVNIFDSELGVMWVDWLKKKTIATKNRYIVP